MLRPSWRGRAAEQQVVVLQVWVRVGLARVEMELAVGERAAEDEAARAVVL